MSTASNSLTQRERDRNLYLVSQAEDEQLHLPTTNSETRREQWRDLAVCADDPGDHWFPDARATNKHLDKCLARCAQSCNVCPVIDECLGMALSERHRYGIFANTLPSTRSKMLQQRN